MNSPRDDPGSPSRPTRRPRPDPLVTTCGRSSPLTICTPEALSPDHKFVEGGSGAQPPEKAPACDGLPPLTRPIGLTDQGSRGPEPSTGRARRPAHAGRRNRRPGPKQSPGVDPVT